MRDMGGRLLFSASDLMRFSGCRHATTLDLQRLHGTAPIPRQDTEDAELLQRHGDAHEAAYLEALKAQGLTVVEMTQGDLVENARETADVLRAGPAVVF